MSIKKLLGVVLICTLMMLPAVACDGGVDYKPLDLVPEGADMLAGIRVSEAVRAWQVFNELEGTEETSGLYDEIREEMLDSSGLDLSTISEFFIFADMSETDSMDSAGFIMTGNFKIKEIVSGIEEKASEEFTTEEYGGYTIYKGPDDNSLVAINNQIIIMGSMDSLKSCIDVANGEAQKLSGSIIEAYNDLGDVILRLVMEIPDEVREEVAGEPEADAMMPGMDALSEMQTLGLSMDIGTETLTVTMNADFPSPESAADAAESLETMLDFFSMMSEEAAELFDQIEITVTDARMTLNYEVELAELGNMAESFKDGFGFPMIPSGPPDMEGFEFPGDMEDFEFPDMPDDMPDFDDFPDDLEFPDEDDIDW